VGLLRLAWEAANVTYLRTQSLLEDLKEIPEGSPVRRILLEYLLRMEGFIHVFFTLIKSYSDIWGHLRADVLWERIREERKACNSQKRGDLPSREEVQKIAAENADLCAKFEKTLKEKLLT